MFLNVALFSRLKWVFLNKYRVIYSSTCRFKGKILFFILLDCLFVLSVKKNVLEVITNFYWVFPLRIFKMNFYIQYRKHNLKNIFVHLKQLHFKTLLPTFIQLKGKSYWLCIVYIPFVSHCVFPGKSIIICHLWRITHFSLQATCGFYFR